MRGDRLQGTAEARPGGAQWAALPLPRGGYRCCGPTGWLSAAGWVEAMGLRNLKVRTLPGPVAIQVRSLEFGAARPARLHCHYDGSEI